jgi:hypothetical protein
MMMLSLMVPPSIPFTQMPERPELTTRLCSMEMLLSGVAPAN